MARRSTDHEDALDSAVLALAPEIPPWERRAVVAHAADARALRQMPAPRAAWLALIAVVRHTFTDYDALLSQGYGLEAARHFCLAPMNEVLEAWGCARKITAQTPELTTEEREAEKPGPGK